MTVTAALVRSPLHLAFLSANEADVDHVLYRDEHMARPIAEAFPGRGVALGRERRLARHPLAALRGIAANRRYYREVRSRLTPLAIDRLILFLEGEPLERMLADRFPGEIELWEEGLSHYVDLTGPLWYGARGLAQILSGYYPRGAIARRANRDRFLVRDRFERHNLNLPAPLLAPPTRATLVIGSPLAEDRIVSRAQVTEGLARLAAASPRPLAYLPHPREDLAEVAAMLARVPGIGLAPQPHGLARHVEAYGYGAFVAAASTAVLDLGVFARSLYVPRLFGLTRMHDALARWAANPVRVVTDQAEVAAFLDQADERWPPG